MNIARFNQVSEGRVEGPSADLISNNEQISGREAGMARADVETAEDLRSLSREELSRRVVKQFPSLIEHQSYTSGLSRTRADIVYFLNINLLSGTIPRNKNGDISRGWLVGLTNIGKGAISKRYAGLLRDYESAIALASAPEPDTDLVERFPSLKVHQGYEYLSVQARIVEVLNGWVALGRFPRARDVNQINKRILCEISGLSETAIQSNGAILQDYAAILPAIEAVDAAPLQKFGLNSSAYRAGFAFSPIVDAHPILLRHQMYDPSRNAGKLVAFLNDAVLLGTVVTGNRGRINRTWIVECTGIAATTLSNDYDVIVRDYDTIVAAAGSTYDDRLKEMRSWLEQQMADGSLEVRDGKFSRKEFFDHFNITPSGSVEFRDPEIHALFSEIDTRVRGGDYIPKAWEDEVDRLRTYLENEPPLGKNGKTINQRVVEDDLGFARYACKRKPHLAAVILRAEAELVRRIEQDPTIAVMCGRLFRFQDLTKQGWPFDFTVRFKKAFERQYRSRPKTEVQQVYWQAIEVMAFLQNTTSKSGAHVRDVLCSGYNLREADRDWVFVTLQYRDDLRARNSETSTCNNKIAFVSSVFRALANEGVLPSLDLPLRPFRDDDQTHIRSVAEVTPETLRKPGKPHVDDYLNFAMSRLTEGAELREIEITAEEQSDFTNILRSELEKEDYSSVDDPAAVILKVLTRRLGLIGDAALAVVEDGRKALAYGREVMSNAEELGLDWHLIIGREMNENDRKVLLRHYFPEGEAGRDRAIGNLLRLIATRFDFQMPQQATFSGRNSQFFKHRAIELGGAQKLKSFLFPDTRAIAGAITLYLLASGNNVSVGRTLNWDCLEESEQARLWKIKGNKGRAGGKPIHDTLEERSDAIQAVRWLQDAFEPIRVYAGDDEARLFLVQARGSAGFKMIEEWTFRSHFKEIVANVPELAELPLTPNMIRPSVLLKAVLENDGRTRVSRALGQHTASVHQGYIDKYPTKVLHDLDIRYFANSMETIIIKTEKAQEFLGIDKANFERRVETVMKTGLGTQCADRHGRHGISGDLCKSMDCWNDCPQLILIARSKDMAILQIWQTSLRAVEGDWVRDQPERWGEVWLPWLCFVDAVEIKMRQSFPTVWRDATKLATEMMAEPGYSHKRLF